MLLSSEEYRYQELLQQYNRTLQQFEKMVRHRNGVLLLIATSRKMVRFLEYLRKAGIVILPKNQIVISEYAIAFCMERLCRQYGEKLQVLITDDVTDTGHTIDSIAACVENCTKRKPFALPFVTRQQTILFDHACNIGEGNYADSHLAAYCTMRIVQSLLSDGIPLDMEYPIWKISFPMMFSRPDNLQQMLSESFDSCTVYAVRHWIKENDEEGEVIYYTVLLDQESDSRLATSDFAKIRFYVSRRNLYIELFSPRTIEEEQLRNIRQFRNKEVQNIWEKLYDQLNTPTDECSCEERHHYILLSQVVMLNYLHSIITMTNCLPSLYNFFRRLGLTVKLSIDAANLSLLLSPEVTYEIAPLINSLLQSGCRIVQEQSSLIFSIEESIISDDSADKYYVRNVRMLSQCATVEEAVVSIFRNQRLLMANGALAGESFNSLYERMKLFSIYGNIQPEIHQTIDYMIDEASVAPSYMRILKRGNYYWKRLFHAGDSEATLDRLCLIVLYTLDQYLQIRESNSVDKDEFYTLISMVFCSRLYPLAFPEFEKKMVPREEFPYIKPLFQNIGTIDLLEYMQRLGYLSIDKDEQIFSDYSIAQSLSVEDDCTSLDSLQKQHLKEFLSFLWKYSRHHIKSLHCNLLYPSPAFLQAVMPSVKTYIEKKVKCYKNNGFSGKQFENDLLTVMDGLLSILQGYQMCFEHNAPHLEKTENEYVKGLWYKTFDFNRRVGYTDTMIVSIKNVSVLFLLLLVIHEKYIRMDDKTAQMRFLQLEAHSGIEERLLLPLRNLLFHSDYYPADVNKEIDIFGAIIVQLLEKI